MLGHMLLYIRKNKKLTKSEIAKSSNIDIGHLTHIEKCERKPSNKVLKNICGAMKIPYQPLLYTLDKKVTEEQENYDFECYIPYNKVLAIDKLNDFIICPSEIPSACVALKMNDISMEPMIPKDVYIFIEYNVPLSNKDIGLFYYKNSFIIRKFIIRKNDLVLRSENKTKYPDIIISKDDNISMVGKVLAYQDSNKQTVLL